MAAQTEHDSGGHVPSIVSSTSPLVRRLLGLGMPMGPNVQLTVRGRRTGQPRTFPVAVMKVRGRRYVAGAYGDSDWTRNLRAAGEAVVREGRGRPEAVTAAELTPDAAAAVLAEALPPYLRSRLMARMLRSWYALTVDSRPADYLAEARRHPMFELRARS